MKIEFTWKARNIIPTNETLQILVNKLTIDGIKSCSYYHIYEDTKNIQFQHVHNMVIENSLSRPLAWERSA